STNVGKIRLRNLVELQAHVIDEIAVSSDVSEIKTPEKSKRARKTRSATTAKKKSNVTTAADPTISTNTTIKRTGKKEPLPGQLRIDAYFKSSAKNYKVNALVKTSTSERAPRRGCKRLFKDESVTTTTKTSSKFEYCAKSSTKRTQPPRNCNAKSKVTEPVDGIIDLCDLSSDEEVQTNEQIKNVKPQAILQPVQTQAMVCIPAPLESHKTDTSSKENEPKGRARKRCPAYKVVEGTTFVVDGFQFGDIPNATHYFLSHYHADHYVGLTRKFAHPLYMSPITARLVRTFIPIDNQYIHEIDVDQTIVVNDVEITALDANHCPGAILLLFKLSTGQCILHTGDFRASFDMESLPIFWNVDIDLLYLDTTYLAKNYDFCHQTESIDRAILLVRQFHEKNANKRILHVCGSYLIGKEKVWLALAQEFDLQVWTEPHRREAIDCLNWPELRHLLCDNAHNANMHVISMGKLSYPQLAQYFTQFEEQYDMLLAIRPSGWEKNTKPSYGKRISVIGVEYSEHSSYKELERFVRFIKPNRVISTVPVGRDLCVTANVPTKWYKYNGPGGMLSKSFQPSITTFMNTPHRRVPLLANDSTEMAVSPVEE
ncbi:Snm1, partial [Drosophila busckii]